LTQDTVAALQNTQIHRKRIFDDFYPIKTIFDDFYPIKIIFAKKALLDFIPINFIFAKRLYLFLSNQKTFSKKLCSNKKSLTNFLRR